MKVCHAEVLIMGISATMTNLKERMEGKECHGNLYVSRHLQFQGG
jgi:hypothetical protein